MCFSKANTCLAKCLSLLFAMLVINCGGRDMERQHGHEYDAVQRISSMMSEGRYMQVLSITDTLLGLPDVSGDVKGTALGYKALAHIMTNMLDSADIYITELEEILDNDTGFHHNALIGYTARGIYAIKKELDYSKAMSCFYEAMEIAEMRRDTLNQVVSLCNLVNVCQLRKDTSGLRYAQTAYSLSRSKKNPDYNEQRFVSFRHVSSGRDVFRSTSVCGYGRSLYGRFPAETQMLAGAEPCAGSVRYGPYI